MPIPLLIIGAGSVGGHIALNLKSYPLENYSLLGFLDDDPKKIEQSFLGYPVIGNVEYLSNLPHNIALIIGIAFPVIKKGIINRISKIGNYEFPNLIAKSSWISNQVTFGKGIIIYPNCAINYGTSIDDFVVINMNCAVGHDCKIGAFSSLAPGVNLAGHTKIGLGVDIGIGAATKQEVSVGNYSIIGGHSMVIHDIPEKVVAVGTPAKIIKRSNV
ncbi:MAG TPA: NeuD/PglB/VioB family sugar acetyltransferase [Chitinophagaceae bacterium]|nr:NeuD/PglB/VioB family sugar acetyltransferase [Chitinophagaceae bacterium]